MKDLKSNSDEDTLEPSFASKDLSQYCEQVEVI